MTDVSAGRNGEALSSAERRFQSELWRAALKRLVVKGSCCGWRAFQASKFSSVAGATERLLDRACPARRRSAFSIRRQMRAARSMTEGSGRSLVGDSPSCLHLHFPKVCSSRLPVWPVSICFRTATRICFVVGPRV